MYYVNTAALRVCRACRASRDLCTVRVLWTLLCRTLARPPADAIHPLSACTAPTDRSSSKYSRARDRRHSPASTRSTSPPSCRSSPPNSGGGRGNVRLLEPRVATHQVASRSRQQVASRSPGRQVARSPGRKRSPAVASGLPAKVASPGVCHLATAGRLQVASTPGRPGPASQQAGRHVASRSPRRQVASRKSHGQ